MITGTDAGWLSFSCYSCRERFQHELHHAECQTSSKAYPPVPVPTRQRKSRLATGYFLFMWCGALVKKGTLRFGALCHSGFLVWCWSLVPGWPSREGELNSCPPAPLTPRFKASVLLWALGHTKSLLIRRRLTTPFIILLSKGHFSSQSAALLLLLWKVCLFHCITFFSVLPPQRSRRAKMGWVQSSQISALLLIYSHQTALSFLTSCFMRYAPCLSISCSHCVIPTDTICSLVP